MRLSCNFVNVYTIAYRVQFMYTCTRAHPQRTSWRGNARVSDKSADKSARIVVRVRLVASWTRRGTPTSALGSSRGSRRGCPCRCWSHGIPTYRLNSTAAVSSQLSRNTFVTSSSHLRNICYDYEEVTRTLLAWNSGWTTLSPANGSAEVLAIASYGRK